MRVYLPPDANTLLSVTDHCLRSRNYVNVIVAGKQPALQWLNMDEAIRHCTIGLGIWEFASNDGGARARSRDGLRGRYSDSRNTGGGRLAAASHSRSENPRRQCGGSDDAAACRPNTRTAFPTRNTIRSSPGQADHLQLSRLSLADSPADLPAHQSAVFTSAATRKKAPQPRRSICACCNEIDRFHLAIDVIDRVPAAVAGMSAHLRQELRNKLIDHWRYVRAHGRGHAGDSGLAIGRLRMKILVLNAGSSSLKFNLFEGTPESIETDSERVLAKGQVERVDGMADALKSVFEQIGSATCRRRRAPHRPRRRPIPSIGDHRCGSRESRSMP